MPASQRPADLARHVLADLRAQRDELLAEFGHWQERAGQAGVLAQHRSQIARITEILTALLNVALADGALALGGAPAVTAGAGQIGNNAQLEPLLALRRPLGAVHFFWDFFRDKFTQRDTSLYTDHLNAADTLAWNLYRPFWETVVAALEADQASRSVVAPLSSLKEPPLTFYHVERTPFAQPRASVFRPPGLDARDVATYSDTLARLPIPIIGLPWYQARRLPALAFVGHEVGHVVSYDLGLGDHLDDLICALDLPERRKTAWLAWRDEIFADVFGALSLGTAYVAQLAVELAAERRRIIGQRIDSDKPGSYPTSALRIALCEETLRRVAVAVPERWLARAFPMAGDSGAYEGDIPAIVEAMVEGQYPTLGQVGLRTVLPWTQADEDSVERVATQSLEVNLQRGAPSVRHYVAGAVRARMYDARRYRENDLDSRLARRIIDEFGKDIRADTCNQVRARLSALTVPATESGFMAPPPTVAEQDRHLGITIARSLGFLA